MTRTRTLEPDARTALQEPAPAALRASGVPETARRIAAVVGPVLLVAGIIVARNPPALFRAEFWAEDATEFFFTAMGRGAASIALPVYGYQFLLSRIVAYLATLAPVLYAPYVYAWASLLLNAVSIAYITRPGFAWIAPRLYQRLLLAAALAIGPGTSEAFLNLANLPNVVALLGLLLLIERPFALDPPRAIALLVLTLSSGQMVLWLPVVVYLAWVQRSRAHALIALAIGGVAALNIFGTGRASSDAHLLSHAGVAVIARVLVENAFTRLIPGPFLGEIHTRTLMLASARVFWSFAVAGFVAVAALVRVEYRRQAKETALLVLAYAGAIGGLGVVAMSRNYAIPQLVRESGSLLPELRYSVLPGAVVLIFWAWWLLRPRPRRWPWILGRCAAAYMLLTNVTPNWDRAFPRQDLHWPEKAAHLQAVLDERARTGSAALIHMRDLAIHPVGWLPNNERYEVALPPR
jgi:hypothetical protein